MQAQGVFPGPGPIPPASRERCWTETRDQDRRPVGNPNTCPVHRKQPDQGRKRSERTYHVLDPTVLPFCILSDGDNIHIVVRGLIAFD